MNKRITNACIKTAGEKFVVVLSFDVAPDSMNFFDKYENGIKFIVKSIGKYGWANGA